MVGPPPAVAAKTITITPHTSHTRYAMVAAGSGITIADPFAAGPWLGKGVALRRFAPKPRLTNSLCHPTGRAAMLVVRRD